MPSRSTRLKAGPGVDGHLGILRRSNGLLQVTLDLGKDQDWFASPLIAGMSLTSAIAFIAFLIWELTSEHPIVNLRVFRHLGFTVPLIVLAFGLGGFFATNVLTPLWLQTNMGYTSAQAGMAASATGILAVATGPLVAMMVARVDNRIIAFAGVSWLLVTSLMRGVANTDMTFWQVWTVLLLVGAAMPAFFMPLMTMSLAAVEPEETAGASGLSNFVRTLAGAVATSLLTTAWEDSAASHHAELAGSLNGLGGAMGSLERGGLTATQAVMTINRMVDTQAVQLATNQMFWAIAAVFGVSLCLIWAIPRPRRRDAGAMAH